MAPKGKSSSSIAAAAWLKWPGTQAVFTALGNAGGEVRAVGGAVRDTLLGREVIEVDFATPLLPEAVIHLAEASGLKAVPTGLDHGTVTLIADGKPFEVTTLRKDVATDGRRAVVAYTEDWKLDAQRRDFTINALYAGADGKLYDPLGGYGDIEARRVRFIGDARMRVREDYLRILRFFRFNAELGSTGLDAGGLRACVFERAGLRTLSSERVHAELFRLLEADGALRSLRAMFDHGLLVQVLDGVPYLARLERLVSIGDETGQDTDALLRLCALAVAVEEDAVRLAGKLRLSNAEAERLERAACHRGISAAAGEGDIRRILFQRGRSGARDAAVMAWAVSGDKPGDTGWRGLLASTSELEIPEFPVHGSDIIAMGVAEGPEVGSILEAVQACWISQDFTPGRDKLIDMARELAAGAKKEAEHE